jgi:malate synthase
MFKKVSNVDLMNSIKKLENKLDILNTNLDSQSLQGCCNCKTKEALVYKELHDYLESKFSDLVEKLTLKFDEKNKTNKIEREELVTNIYDTFDKYKVDIMNNLQTIITNLSLSDKTNNIINSIPVIEQLKNEIIKYKTDTEQDFCKILTLFENVNRSIDDKLINLNNIIQTVGENTNGKFDVIDVKLNSIYFENEIIKHQFLLEEQIRQSIEEINNINNSINDTIRKLDSLI